MATADGRTIDARPSEPHPAPGDPGAGWNPSTAQQLRARRDRLVRQLAGLDLPDALSGTTADATADRVLAARAIEAVEAGVVQLYRARQGGR